MIREVHVVTDGGWEVNLLAAPGASLKEASVSLFYLPKVVKVVVAADAVPVSIGTQHIQRRVRLPISRASMIPHRSSDT